MRRAKRHLLPIIQERLANEERYGEGWEERPNDLLTWLLGEVTIDSHQAIDDLVLGFLSANFGAIHSTNETLSIAVSSLALHSEYVDELRDEIENVISEHGWTKAGMGHMRKLDSFLKESQRCYKSFAYGVERKVLKDFTFSNGVTVPAGATLAIPVWAIHHDNDYFPDADKFDGFRFSRMRENPDQSSKHQMVTPTTDYLIFGTGRHACPGRFFAVNEVKAIIAHLLLAYDFKLEVEGALPPVRWFGSRGVQDDKTKFWFRRRKCFTL
ncbi:hypothetical protein GYMLUDRAFT_38189 [Collybiopsis luxurians FD-317 M1]|nr:hypothetical protein GYMLUDRAFT_38189 [Collybiopsis luxurians FD-317 M1]